MKKKKRWITFVVIAAIIIAVIALISTAPNWSNLTYEAVEQETVIMPDGENRLIVERTTEIYGSTLNSLGIGAQTKLLDSDGNEISLENLQPGTKVEVTLKDAFTEEIPFYYPTVYEIIVME